jgi:hypothetical protein
MNDQSPYEGMLDGLGGKISLGQVIDIDADSRTVRVKTLGNANHGTDDQDLPNVKVLHMAWNPDGSYALAMPLIGSYYIIGYINSEPVLLGAYPLSNTSDGGGRDNQQNLLPGDYAFVTAQGSSVIIRSGGTVELQSTPNCRTWWLPTNETITTVCQNQEIDTSGGFSHWTIDPNTGATLLEVKAYTDFNADTAVDLQVGTTSSGAALDLEIGPTDENLNVTSPTFSLTVQADGTTALNVGSGQVTINITPDGKISINTQSDANITVGGDANVNTTGDCNVTAGGNVVAKGTQVQLNGSAGMVLTTETDPVVDLITGTPTVGVQTVLAGE